MYCGELLYIKTGGPEGGGDIYALGEQGRWQGGGEIGKLVFAMQKPFSSYSIICMNVIIYPTVIMEILIFLKNLPLTLTI